MHAVGTPRVAATLFRRLAAERGIGDPKLYRIAPGPGCCRRGAKRCTDSMLIRSGTRRWGRSSPPSKHFARRHSNELRPVGLSRSAPLPGDEVRERILSLGAAHHVRGVVVLDL